jgi:hypothetical protein
MGRYKTRKKPPPSPEMWAKKLKELVRLNKKKMKANG